MKRFWWALLLAAALLFGAGAGVSADTDNEIIHLTISGPVNQAMTSYFANGLAEAEAADAYAVLIELDTPGGTLDATLEIVQILRNAERPILIYVSPVGAQAASAGSIITLAGHAAGMAPETVIGAASPVMITGEDIAETLYRKAVEDTKAVVRNLAARRGEQAVTVAEEMIEDARAVTGQEALELGLIDAVAIDIPDLLRQLDGLEVVVGTETIVLETAGAQINPRPMSAVESFLFALASILMNPLFISALIGLGVQAIIFEFSNPGGWVAGFIGFVCLGLALYGLGQLPTNILGLALILVAFILLVMELFTPTYGALAVTGTITLIAGFLVLFNSPGTPEFARISWSGAIIIGLGTASMMLFFIGKGLAAQRRQAVSGREGLVGRIGQVRQTLSDSGGTFTGTVFVYGALWQAASSEPIEKGEKVTIQAVDGLTLRVKKYSEGGGIEPVS